jgi:hypothetical protein
MRSTLLVLVIALSALVRSAAAQVSVVPIRDLAFGPVIIGVPSYVPPTHPTRSGQFRITAPVGARLRLRFTLPNRLNGPGSATLPIDFGSNDALSRGTAPNSVPETFNPKGASVQLIVPTPTVNVWIGGIVSPAGNQSQGNYSGTIIFTVTVL